MVGIKIYQVIRDLIKDPQSLINYVENYLLKVADSSYVAKEIDDNTTKLIVYDDYGNAELSVNHEVRIKGNGKMRNLLNALVLRYLGTDGTRKITILLLQRNNRIYRVNDLPRVQSLPIGLIGLMLISIIALSIIIAVLRIINIIPSIHLIIILLLSPLIIPIIYSYILQLRIRHGDLRNSRIIKFVLEYGDLEEQKFNDALRLLSRIENSKSLNEIRRFVLSLVNDIRTKPQNFYEEYIDIESVISNSGIKNYGIYLVNVNQCNAASIGLPGINYVILTSRLVSCLNSNELTAVVMHEIGHIVHGDSAKTLFLISLAQLDNIALITYIIPLMSLPAIPILITALFLELFGIISVMKLSEYSADKYAMRFISRKDLAMALIKVTWKELHSELMSRRLRIFTSHPSVSSRLVKIIR
ncbi:M48 family metalloprotease [Vulcanisaeta moutnovskia]|uniref:M48 family metalloprotease n=1 Tax=Vulcanisaeta moutnovskia TaxID=985052 RepID=UPI000A00BB22|nr:M48 family metallopeptidase [Vulcanisaeta moutnovskia]